MAEYDIPVEPLRKEENTTLIGLIKEYDGYAVFFIDSISRVCTHQLVRHTSLNYSQRSQRYVKEDENQFIIPPSVRESSCEIKNEELSKYIKGMLSILLEELEVVYDIKPDLKEKIITAIRNKLNSISDSSIKLEDLLINFDNLAEIIYEYAVYKCKVKREDGRFILPHGRKTTIVVSGTLSWIKDFIVKRTDIHAQWEIRNIANQMKKLLKKEGIEI
ncbi:MAG: hypothetical protein DSY60_00715 [Persephonella sp.]|nr:MAG: hypothetical protein DSY60_00715 [Persephonella sp.]